MTWQIGLYFGTVVAAILLTGFLAWQAWQQRSVAGSRYYFWLAVSMCLMAVGEALSMLSPTLALAVFWFNTRFLPFAVIPPLWLLFVLEYSGRRNWVSKGLIGGLFFIPLVTQVMVWTNSLHGFWVQQEVVFHQNGPFWIADISQRLPGLWYLVHTFTSVILMLAGSVLLLRTAWRNARLYRLQAILLTASALIPVLSTLVTTFNLLPKGSINPTVPGLALAAFLAAAAIFRFDFLKKTPSEQEETNQIAETRGNRALALFLLIYALMACGLTAFGIISYQNYQAKFHLQVEKQLLSVVDLKVRGLTEWRSERLADANLLEQNPVFAGLVQNFLNNPGDANSAGDLQTWLDSLRKGYKYERIFLLDPHAVERLASPATPEAFSGDLADLEQTVLKAGRVNFLDFHRDKPGGPINLALLVPIYAGADLARPLGMVVLRMDPGTYLYPYLTQWPAPSQTAETLLVRLDEQSALYLNPVRFQPDSALNLRVPVTKNNVLAVKAVLGQTGVVEGIDYRGEPVIGAVGTVPGSPWILLARMDLAEANAPLKERLWLTIIFFGALILASGAGLAFLWRQQRMQYFRGKARVAEELRESEDKFKYVFDYSPIGKSITHPAGEVVVNKAFCELLGYNREEMASKNWQDFTHPDDIKATQKIIDSIYIGETEMGRLEKRLIRKDGSIIWTDVNTSARRGKDGKPVYLMTNVMDITERKMAASRQKFFYDTLNASANELYIFDSDSLNFEFVSAGALRNLGYSMDELSRMTPLDLKPEFTPEKFAQIVAPLRKGDVSVVDFETLHQRADGSLYPVEDHLQMFSEGERKVFLAVVLDITERKRAESDLEQQRAELARSNAELEQFAYISSHDLQEPLRMVASYMELLERRYKGKLDKNADDFIGFAVDGARRMQRLINDLLAYSRVGRHDQPFASVSCEALLDQALDNLQLVILESKASINHDPLPDVLGDETQLVQLFQNLVGNAIKFHGKKIPRVHISASLSRESALPPGDGSKGKEEWLFSVRDNGIGIDPQYAERIFIIFQRLHNREQYTGTGIGLAICRKIVQHHGGRIWVESTPGSGATFYFTLPR
jgi:PAS domain S-box-containing protein